MSAEGRCGLEGKDTEFAVRLCFGQLCVPGQYFVPRTHHAFVPLVPSISRPTVNLQHFPSSPEASPKDVAGGLAMLSMFAPQSGESLN